MISSDKLHTDSRLRDVVRVTDMVAVPCLIIETGSYVIRHANPAALRTSSAREGSLCYAASHGFDAPCERYGAPCPLRQVLTSGQPVVVEHVHRGVNGSPRTVQVHAHPIFDRDGNVTHILESSIDVTDRQRASEAKAALGAALSCHPSDLILVDPTGALAFATSGVGALLPELATVEVGEQVALPESGDPSGPVSARIPLLGAEGNGSWHLIVLGGAPGSKSAATWGGTANQIAVGVAHDVGNILQTISAQAEALRCAGAAQREAADAILRQVARGAQLVRRLRDFSRRSESASQPVDLAECISKEVEDLRPVLPEGVEMVVDLRGGADPRILGDETQIAQMLTNLVLNAGDAVGERGTVRVDLERLDLAPEAELPFAGMWAGAWLHIRVEDDGCGIPLELRGKVFRPFFTTRSDRDGAGLGLAQAYGIVKQHGGFIDFTSEVGVGTRFDVFLPAYDSSVEDVLPPSPSVMAGTGGATVLVVEDEEALLRILQKALSSCGYTVLGATCGAVALEVMEQAQKGISVVIADLNLPDMSGLEVLARVRKEYPLARRLLTTAGGVEHMDLGDVDCALAKPFSLPALLQAVRELLDVREAS